MHELVAEVAGVAENSAPVGEHRRDTAAVVVEHLTQIFDWPCADGRPDQGPGGDSG